MTAERCTAVVYRRDTYRRTGRGRNGYEMHYERCQCKRAAYSAFGLCEQRLRYEVERARIPSDALAMPGWTK